MDFSSHPQAQINKEVPRFTVNPENWGPGKMAGNSRKRYLFSNPHGCNFAVGALEREK